MLCCATTFSGAKHTQGRSHHLLPWIGALWLLFLHEHRAALSYLSWMRCPLMVGKQHSAQMGVWMGPPVCLLPGPYSGLCLRCLLLVWACCHVSMTCALRAAQASAACQAARQLGSGLAVEAAVSGLGEARHVLALSMGVRAG